MTAKKAPAKKAKATGIETLPKAGFHVQVQAAGEYWGIRLTHMGRKERGRAKTFAAAVKWAEDTAANWES